MGELTGRLIEMNSRMVVTEDAIECVVLGMIAFVVMVIWTVWMARAKKKVLAYLFAVIALGCAAYAAYGVSLPRAKEIHACADGPISLETLAVRYDIVKVDGKELTLRVR